MKSILLLVILCKLSTAKNQLGNYVPICDAQDSNLNECVVRSANAFISILGKGVKSFNFPPLDPLVIPEMNVDQNNAPITLKIKLLNTIHTGLSTLRFYSASVHPLRNRWIMNATLPTYSLHGRYKGSGRLLLIPIIGEGEANFTYSNMKVDFVMDGNVKSQNGEKIFNLAGLKVYFTFDKCYISMTNLFGGNNQLSEAVNQFVKSNSKEVMNGLKGSLEKIYSALYLGLIRKLLENVPLSEMFSNIQ